MSAMPKPLITPQEYLAREHKAEFRSEFYRGEIFARAGATQMHVIIADNFSGELRNHFKGGTCIAYSSDMRVKVSPSGLYTYPDVSIVCGERKFDDQVCDTLVNPQVVIEVLSDSTESYDRGAKFAQYRQIASLREFVLASQDQPLVERYVRQPDETWVLTIFGDIAGAFELATVPVRIAMAEIYRGVTLPEDAAAIARE